ncbi:MAG: SRPBCC family protein [Elusimicrobiota bacterium]
MTTRTKTETFVYATFIRTTPEKLWEALTNGDFSQKYWFGFRVQVEQKVGGRIRIDPPKGAVGRSDHGGDVLACEKYKKLIYTWMKEKHEKDPKRDGLSRVTYELTPAGDYVKLTLIHENLSSDDVVTDPDTLRGINNGWPAVISSLKSLLETGTAISVILPKDSQGC